MSGDVIRMTHHHDSLFALAVALMLSGVMFFGVYTTRASGGLSGLSDVATSSKAATPSDHEITFITANGVSAGEAVKVNFAGATGNPFSLSGINQGDLDLAVSDGGCGGTFTEQPIGSVPFGMTWGVGIIGTTVTFTSGTAIVPAGRCVRVLVGTNASFGAPGIHQATNPVNASTPALPTKILIEAGTDSGELAVGILANDGVNTRVNVPDLLQVSTSAADCPFGILDQAIVNTCTYNHIVRTNAKFGYSTTIVDTTGPTTLQETSMYTTIPAFTGLLVPGVSGYGVSTSSLGALVAVAYQPAAGCANGSPLLNSQVTATTGTPQVIASASQSVANDVVTMCHKATISATQTPGAYSQIVTLTTTANF